MSISSVKRSLAFAFASLALCIVGITNAQSQDFVSGFSESAEQQKKSTDQKNKTTEQTNAEQAKSAGEKLQKPTPKPISKKRRGALMEFVEENHSELVTLINLLKEKRPVQYEAAMRSLDRSATQLNAFKKSQSEERYQQALNDWKLRSRIQLLSAQLSITDTPKRRKRLETLITQQINNRKRHLESELERTQVRLDKLQSSLSTLNENRDSEIKRQMDLVISTAGRIQVIRKKQAERQSNATLEKNAEKKKSDDKKSDDDANNNSKKKLID